MTSELLPDKRSLLWDIESAIQRYPDDAHFLALANTLATNCLWYHIKYLSSLPALSLSGSVERYLPIIEELKARPYLNAFHSAPKVRKVKLFLAYPRTSFAIRTLVRTLLSRK